MPDTGQTYDLNVPEILRIFATLKNFCLTCPVFLFVFFVLFFCCCLFLWVFFVVFCGIGGDGGVACGHCSFCFCLHICVFVCFFQKVGPDIS